VSGHTFGDMGIFVRFLLETDPPPCLDPVKCEHFDVCAKEKLACNEFRSYVSYCDLLHGLAEPRIPKRRYYIEAMEDCNGRLYNNR
jgi:hypothetical protein